MSRLLFLLRSCLALTAVAMALAAIPASASLGQTVSSVTTDAQHLRASVRVTQAANYSVQEMQAAGGNVVREYVSPQGQVFAVAWQGHFRPNLQQLLGSYYTRAQQLVQAEKTKHAGRHPISIQQPDLVVQMGGHQRAFSGRVYIPNLVPANVRAQDIR